MFTKALQIVEVYEEDRQKSGYTKKCHENKCKLVKCVYGQPFDIISFLHATRNFFQTKNVYTLHLHNSIFILRFQARIYYMSLGKENLCLS
jgi:hypothetical protein